MYEPRIVIVKQIPARQTTGSIKNYCAPAGEINTSDREISLYCRNAAGEKKDAEQIPRDPNENTAVSFFLDVCIRRRATH